MKDLKRRFRGGLVFCAVPLLALLACTSTVIDTPPVDSTSPRRGGMIRIAQIGEPPSLDVMATTAGITTIETASIYEGLFTLDSQLVPQPSLAQSYQIEDQGLRWVIALRKGVHFHNGQEMTSDDVLASLNRWGKACTAGRILFKNLASMDAPDRYSIVIHLKKPMPVVANLLAVPQNQAAIYPKSIIDATRDGLLQQYVGTGPYKFVVWKPGQYIELARFNEYQARSEPADGMAGRREAYSDSIRFFPVSEVQQRVQGVLTGLYDYSTNISPDFYLGIQATHSVDGMIIKPYSMPVIVFNKKLGIFNNLKMRQAVQAAADVQAMMKAAYGDPMFYRADPSLFFKETQWWSDTGKASYNRNDPVTAKRLLQEAGYHGQTVRILATHEYEFIFKIATVLKSQLAAVGVHAVLEVVDWATVVQRRGDPAAYDIFITQMVWNFDPVDAPYLESSWPGWWDNVRKDALVEQIAMETDYRKRLDLISQLQQAFYEDVPLLKVGDYFDLRIKGKKLQGAGLNAQIPYYFNSWLSR